MAWTGGGGARCRRPWAQGRLVALLLGMCLVYGAASAHVRVRAAGSEAEIVASVRAAAGRGPVRMTFRQDVELRVLLFRWHFYADVVQDDTGIAVRVHNAPKFLSPDVTASLLELSEGLDGFDLELVGQEGADDDVHYVLRGTAKEPEQGGASGGTIWVNQRTWLIDRAVLHYSWGNMTVEQRFQTVDGYALLKEQLATVDRLGATMRVQYGGYSLD